MFLYTCWYLPAVGLGDRDRYNETLSQFSEILQLLLLPVCAFGFRGFQPAGMSANIGPITSSLWRDNCVVGSGAGNIYIPFYMAFDLQTLWA